MRSFVTESFTAELVVRKDLFGMLGLLPVPSFLAQRMHMATVVTSFMFVLPLWCFFV